MACAHTLLDGKRFKIYEADLAEGQGQAGHIIEKTKKSLVVATGQGAISLKTVQPAGNLVWLLLISLMGSDAILK